MIKKFYAKTFIIISMIMVIGTFCQEVPAHAATFNSSDLIDQSVFDNTTAMNGSQIDSWINANFPSSCISTNNGFSAQDPTGYSPSGGFTYGNNVSAGQVIYDAADAYGLNPQVLLATMQKEQSLVSGGAGCSTESYAAAMGYGCPDGGTEYSYSGVNLYSINGVVQTAIGGSCVDKASEVGFSEQVIHAAWLLKFGEQRSEGNMAFDVQGTNFPEQGDSWNNSDDPQSCYEGPMTQGTFTRCPTDPAPVYYDGYTTIDGVSTLMGTGPTAALYWYTPHFSGNENFDNIFDAWFGSTYGDVIGSNTYELFNFGTLQHYYTARQDERFYEMQDGFVTTTGGFPVGPTQESGMVPIYREYNGRLKDYWLLPDGYDRWWALNNGGYADQGIAFYAYPAVAGTSGPCSQGVPVYQLWMVGATNHYYTTASINRYWSIIYGGYIDDGSGVYQNPNVGSVSFCVPSS
jgi:hypothetical protein